jgi:L-fuculose-phosphate aldolase
MNYFNAKETIIEIGKRMYAKGFVASNDGNLSIRLSESEIMITPSGVSKGFMSTSDMLVVDLSGNVLSGNLKPSSEMKMHLMVYKVRPDVFGVCHAHPQIATAFAVARKVCDKIALPEVIFSIGKVALTNYATPSTNEVPESIREVIETSDAVLLSNHGALTVGKDLYDAYYKMETLEHFAGITLYARLLGGEVGLENSQISELLRLRKEVFGKSDIDYLGDGYCGQKDIPKTITDQQFYKGINKEELIDTITKAVIENIGKK